jgi:ornithine cyclodeaminase/alanine dehydrogenase
VLDDRVRQARLPMFKSVGSALQDIVIAELAFDRAVARGLATELPFALKTRRSGKK